MTWFLALPLWGKLALTAGAALAVSLVLCNLIGGPKNPHNFQADSLATTRKAYQQDTLRLQTMLDSLKKAEAAARTAKEVERARWLDAEHRAAAARVSAAAATEALSHATTVRDSLDRAIIVIARQAEVMHQDSTALLGAAAAFGRLTAEHQLTLQRADSLEAGWRRTKDRLALAEAALAVEQKRTHCTWNLVLTRMECPSRGAIGLLGVAAGAAFVSVARGRQ